MYLAYIHTQTTARNIDHAAINIVPGWFCPLPDLFDIPDRCLRAAFF